MKSKFQHRYLSHTVAPYMETDVVLALAPQNTCGFMCYANVNNAVADTKISREFSLYSTSKDN